eukprot:TRINITY_DN506_c0_g2_i1.p2 TRINITY_DN506_c0_g2~~TRINITY_DN506_c0_g2_i1.p2  ORF type:complete len:219 (+),score=98.18 TRINITY_DN506_c0_g2_i1:90-746(+)
MVTGLLAGGSAVDPLSDPRLYRQLKAKLNPPPHYKLKVAPKRVNMAYVGTWLDAELAKAALSEDMVTIVRETLTNLIASTVNPDPCLVQMTAAGFVGDEAAARISSELWQHLLEGQAEADGIPRRILAAMQLAAQAVQEERAALEKQGRKHKKEKRERRRRRDDDDSSSSSSGSRRRRRKEKKEKKEKRDGRSGSRHKDKEARGGGDKERRRRRREAS